MKTNVKKEVEGKVTAMGDRCSTPLLLDLSAVITMARK